MFTQVINLKKDNHRLDWMTQSLSNKQLPFTRLDAVTPDNLQGLDELYAVLLKRGLAPEEACCSLSHRQCWVNLLNSTSEYGLVLEDDVHLSSDFQKILESIEQYSTVTGEHPAVVKLETFYATVTAELTQLKLTDRRHMSKLLSNHGGAAAYVLNRATAAHLVAQFGGFERAVDFELFHPELRADHNLTAYQVLPACVIQDHKMPQPRFASGIPQRLENATKPHKLILVFKSLIKPAYLLFYNAYLHTKGRRRVRVGYEN